LSGVLLGDWPDMPTLTVFIEQASAVLHIQTLKHKTCIQEFGGRDVVKDACGRPCCEENVVTLSMEYWYCPASFLLLFSFLLYCFDGFLLQSTPGCLPIAKEGGGGEVSQSAHLNQRMLMVALAVGKQ
jgi:hypothetical protein